MIIFLIDEAVQSGARRRRACETVGLSCRSVERWRAQGTDGDDGRHGPKKSPKNKLSNLEREKVLQMANTPEYRDLSPRQIVPLLADKSIYVASESSFYRILHQEGQMAHRQLSRPATHKPRQYSATGPEQVLSWDITYLRGPVRGLFYYLYMFVDIWSRKIMGWAVHEMESTQLAAQLLSDICSRIGVEPRGVVLHADNGSAMKGSSMLATIQALGLIPSFSRPHVSDDNPFSESLFRTMKYRPWYPCKPFAVIAQAIQWVELFVRWYNQEHLHSAIGFVTPYDRHLGADIAILDNRRQVYATAQHRHPERWSRHHRQWRRPVIVTLNPDKVVKLTDGKIQQLM